MERLILDQKAKKNILQPFEAKLNFAEERIQKYEVLIKFLDGEIAHFRQEIDEKITLETKKIMAESEKIKAETNKLKLEL